MTGVDVTVKTSRRWTVRRALSAVGQVPELRIGVLAAIAVIALTLLTPNFFVGNNLRALAAGMAVDAIVAIGMTVVLVSGGFDLSVGSVIGFSGMLCGIMIKAGVPIPIAVLGAILAGGAVGVVNGFLIARVGINPLIATIGMMNIVASLTQVATSGSPISMFPQGFLDIGQGQVRGVPILVIVCFVLVFVIDILVRRMRVFRTVYLLGSNEQAARLCGLPVTRLRVGVYILTGALAGLAGVLTTSRLGAAFPLSGSGTELRVITACVLGGASIYGGEGTVIGSFLGVLLMALIGNGLIQMRVSVFWQGFASGLLLLSAVAFDVLSRRRRR